MHKLLNFFCFPALLVGLIFISNGLLGYNKLYQISIETNSKTSKQINSLYSEKEITLKDPPISEVLSSKFLVKIRSKPLNPKIISKIDNKIKLDLISNLSDIDYDHLDTNKKEFVKAVLPIIINENQNILITRNFVDSLKVKLNKFKTLNNNEISKLNNIASKYNIEYANKHKLDLIEEILLKVDVIPNSIALAQAAIESGWGQSRFALEYNALFGEYTYDPNKGVIPLKRDLGDKHFIKAFSSYDNSVSSYFNNINSHDAYVNFRTVRNVMRSKNNFSNIYLLVNNLNTYAEDNNYVNTLKAVIEKNNFDIFDSKVISY